MLVVSAGLFDGLHQAGQPQGEPMLSTLAATLLAAGAFTPTITGQQNSTVSIGNAAPQPRLLTGVLSEPLNGELSQAVADWANANRALLGLPAGVSLRKSEAFGTRFGASFHLVQQVQGIDVHDGETVVTIGAARVVKLVSQAPIAFGSAKVIWNVSAEQALATAAAKVPFAALKADGSPYGGMRGELFFVNGELHAGWWLFVPVADRVHAYYAAVDATNGQLLFIQDKTLHSALSAKVYPSSPGGLDAGVGVTPTVDVELLHDDGGSMVLPGVDGGFLNGDRLTAYNCCVNKDCSTAADAGPARATGMINFMGFNVNYDTAICQRMQRASNDPANHASGDFVYTPVDPPNQVMGNPVPVSQNDPADVDEFAEVHAFWHVNQIYDWETRLSEAAAPIFPTNQPAITSFKMRDERKSPARVPAVWANVTFPDFYSIASNPQCVFMGTTCVINGLTRIDNAAFMPVEGMSQLMIPEYMNDVDTLFIFQGNLADFGYDAPVLWHESGHGVVYSTAGLDPGASLAIDTRSANNEAGAMHEGLADYTAAAFGNDPRIGVYVGPRISGGGMGGPMLSQDVALRDLVNNLSCPDVLWGEVHQDSQHFSAALWDARTNTFAGTDNGQTFDAVIYATLVSMHPKETFASTAAILETHLVGAFPSFTGGADNAMKAIFDARGVTNCSKILDVTGNTTGRPYYGISDPAIAQLPATTQLPGPFQFKIHAPNGIAKLVVTAQGGGGLLGGNTTAKVLAKAGNPITFTLQGGMLVNDSTTQVDFAGSSSLTATANLQVPCNSDLYFTLSSPNGATLQTVKWTVTPPSDCNFTDAGTDAGVDGGTDGGTDGGNDVVNIPFAGEPTGKAPGGCGCGAVDGGLAAMLGIFALALRRRR